MPLLNFAHSTILNDIVNKPADYVSHKSGHLWFYRWIFGRTIQLKALK